LFSWAIILGNDMANNKGIINEKPETARSYRTSIIDDNAVISLNIKWMVQILVLCSMLVYGYYNILNRIEKLENGFDQSSKQIEELVNKHIQEEKIKYNKLEQELQWYEKQLNLNPLSWKKKRGKK
tara:strand:+ start:1345 stop:1722 length:378 start_codon:yes stop_codon:yes gene_type:complete